MAGSLSGLARGQRNHGSVVGRGAGFWPGPQTAEAGCSAVGRWLFGEDSEQCQPGGTRRPLYTANVSIIFYCSMLLYYPFWMFMGFILHIYIIFWLTY